MARPYNEEQDNPNPTWLDPITKLTSMMMGKKEPLATGMPGMVTAPQMASALHAWGQQIPQYDYARRFLPFIDELIGPLSGWADRAWRSVGGRGATRLSPLDWGGEAVAMRVDPSKGRSEVLKLLDPSKSLDTYKTALAKPPGLLPTLDAGLAPNGRLAYYTQPYATPVEHLHLSPTELQRIAGNIADRAGTAGWWVGDLGSHSNPNLAQYKGRYYSYDAGSFLNKR